MPTVIALDVSLSMSRPVPTETSEDYQRRHFAIHGINRFLDQLASNCKLEFVSLVAFSYLYEQLCAFTRDFDSVRTALNKVEAYSKTCFEAVLNGIKTMVTEEWNNVPCQVVMITDGSLGIGAGSLKSSLETANSRPPGQKFPLPYSFPCKLHIVCIGNTADPDVQRALPYYQKLIDIGGNGGELLTLDGPISFRSVEDVFQRLTEKHYNPFCGTLCCGNFECPVQLFPKPDSLDRDVDDEITTYNVSKKIEIVGFIDIKEIGSPPTIARHLILPRSNRTKDKDDIKEGKGNKADDEDESIEDGKTPSFTVLLHGGLKLGEMVAIARVDDDWYGMIYSWADSKKKSNLMMSLFEPGQDSVPWLGSFDQLASCKEYASYPPNEKKPSFSVRSIEKHSYASNCVVWIKPSGLQSDIQKVLRHARKLPDKLHQFYKELNRTRNAALSLGFHPLLHAVALMLERECTMLPGGAHPNAALQLTHAFNFLMSEAAFDATKTLTPLLTNFDSSVS